MSDIPFRPMEGVLSITLGAVGQPGARVFYLQVVSLSSGVQSLLLEKAQALLLAEQIDVVLNALAKQDSALSVSAGSTAPALQPPTAIVFRAGSFGLQYDPVADLVALEIFELLGENQGTPDSLIVWATRQQLRTLSDTAQRVARRGLASTYN